MGADRRSLASEADLKSGMMAPGAVHGLEIINQGVPNPRQLEGSRTVGWAGDARAEKQLGLMDLQQIEKPQGDLQLVFLPEFGNTKLFFASKSLNPLPEASKVVVTTLGPAGLSLHFGPKICIVAADAFKLAGEPVHQLALSGIGHGRERPDNPVTRDRIGRGQGDVTRLSERVGW